MKALEGKKKFNITDAVRNEIIQSISTLVMVYSINPSRGDYTAISQNLVKEFPILADGYGSGYVSSL
jgi:hypothetical protein